MKFIEKIIRNFFTGIITLLPIFITYWIVIQLYTLLVEFIKYIYGYSDDTLITVIIMFFIITVIAGIGQMVHSKAKHLLISIQDKILKKIPFINKIYKFFKEIIELFTSTDEDKKIEVCLVLFAGRESLGFINNKNGNTYTVFVPTSPNPTNGFNIFVQKEELKILKGVTKEEALTNIISLGVKQSDNLRKELEKLN